VVLRSAQGCSARRGEVKQLEQLERPQGAEVIEAFMLD
jgi:hypothetical protein